MDAWSCLWFTSFISIMDAINGLNFTIRYHRATENDVSYELFQNTSQDYRHVQSAIDKLNASYACNDIIIELEVDDDCDLVVDLEGIEPIETDHQASVTVHFELKLKENESFELKPGEILDRVKNILIKIDNPFLVGTESIVIGENITCEQHYDSILGITWPESEADVQHNAMYPPEKSKYIRHASRTCRADGWDSVNLVSWKGNLTECRVIGNVVNMLCYPHHIDRISKNIANVDENELVQVLISVGYASGLVESDDLKLTSTASISVLSLLDSVASTHRNLSRDVLRIMRENVESIVQRYPLSEGALQFKGEQLSVMVLDIYEIVTTSTSSHVHFPIVSRKDYNTNSTNSSENSENEILDITMDTKELKMHHDITIPIRRIIENVPIGKHDTVNRVGVYAYRDTFLFGETAADAVFSQVYSLLIPGMEHVLFPEDIGLYFDTPNDTKSDFKCVFWDEELHTEQDDPLYLELGGWSDYGCTTNVMSNHRVECLCNHLSSFALMTLSRSEAKEIKDLNHLPIVGCSISAIWLFFTLVIYLRFERRTVDVPSKILVVISFNLFCTNMLYSLNIVFVHYGYISSANQNDNGSIACKIMAACFHYFLLASLAWMGANGYYIHASLIGVFKDPRWLVLKMAILASGLPLAIVLPMLATDFEGHYGLVEDEICWIKGGLSICSFQIPLSLITFFTIYIFVLIFGQIKTIRKTDQYSTIKPIVTQFRVGATLTILFYLTWVFDFLAVSLGDIDFDNLFIVCNSFHGVFIFIYYCVFREKSRCYWCGFYPSPIVEEESQVVENPDVDIAETQEVPDEELESRVSVTEIDAKATPSNLEGNTPIVGENTPGIPEKDEKDGQTGSNGPTRCWVM